MKRRLPAGYTLLELIVVIAVFAVFAAMAYGGLNWVLKTRRDIEQRVARIGDYQKAYLRLRDDFQNAASRVIRDTDGNPLPTFRYDSYQQRPEFTRGGWANPAGLPRATFERVSYFLDDSDSAHRKLVRRSWRVLDRAPQTTPVDLVVLEGVDELKWRFLDLDQQWHDAWTPQTSLGIGGLAGPVNPVTQMAAQPVPVAVELKLQTRDWGELRFLFRLGPEGNALAPTLAATLAAGGASGGGGSSGGSSSGGSSGDGSSSGGAAADSTHQ